VGGSPIREALNRLCSEGLVSQRDQRGFCVAPVGVDDLMELLRTRCWVNEIVLRESIARGDDAWEEAIVLAFHRLLRTREFLPDAPGTPNPDWEQRHRTFHSALIAACDSHWLRGFSEMLFDCADRYRHLSGHVQAEPPRDIAGEHRAIMEATINRDTVTAVRLLNEHAILTADLLRRSPGMLHAAELAAHEV
jgi:DNA-binding GntR family transcriptional regulator